MASALRFGDDAGVRARVERLQEDLKPTADLFLRSVHATAEEVLGRPVAELSPALTDLEVKASGMVPRRCVVGPLTLEPLLLRANGPFRWTPSWSAPHNDYLIWADGKRSVLDIYRCAQLESGTNGDSLQEIVDYFEFLAKHGYVEML